jgi:2-polyprenyl-3-methyl-5-hydroxy-6-metoxy-1,4-benzoquinol methylase
MHCPNCDFAWLNPQPLPEDIGKLYAEYYTHQVQGSTNKRLACLRKTVKASILRAGFGYAIDGANGLLGWTLSPVGPLKDIVGGSVMWLKADERGRLLDVGCGNGQFLAQMQKLGWEVMGVELDPEAVRIAEERFGLRVFQGTLEEARLPDGSFDTVTMNHVIEHVPNPIGLLAECRRILRPGGKLVVVTPNIESLGHRLFREAWRGLEVPRHLYIFSPRALQECAERAGLKVLKLWTTARSALWMWAASRLIRRNGILPGGSPQRLGLWLKLEGLAFWAIAYGLCALREAGEEIVLMASKGDEA